MDPSSQSSVDRNNKLNVSIGSAVVLSDWVEVQSSDSDGTECSRSATLCFGVVTIGTREIKPSADQTALKGRKVLLA